jgi:hypothetical protein
VKIYRTAAEVKCPFCGAERIVPLWYRDNFHLEVACDGCSAHYLVRPIIPYLSVKITTLDGRNIDEEGDG